VQHGDEVAGKEVIARQKKEAMAASGGDRQGAIDSLQATDSAASTVGI